MQKPLIKRDLAPLLTESATYYPVITVTGPRQSGKTTLCRATFPTHRYVSLEAFDIRRFAQEQPRAFLKDYNSGAIIDEVQRAPQLLSYLQEEVDLDDRPGRFILTGSQHFGLISKVTQSLAGRTAVFTLLPPSIRELRRFEDYKPKDLMHALLMGAYPRIHHRNIPPNRWLADYIMTYMQRDLREVSQVRNLRTFTLFAKLCAARTGSELNLSSLANDAGITHATAKAWLSLLETAFLLTTIPAWHRNIRKRLVKRPKLHFLDTGLVCTLLGIENAEQLRHHPLRGAIFESWVASEVLKLHFHAGKLPSLSHFRVSQGIEVDLVAEIGSRMLGIEVKSGTNLQSKHFKNLTIWSEWLENSFFGSLERFLVYGGNEKYTRSNVTVLPWSQVDQITNVRSD